MYIFIHNSNLILRYAYDISKKKSERFSWYHWKNKPIKRSAQCDSDVSYNIFPYSGIFVLQTALFPVHEVLHAILRS